jgi:hypothetical protein
VVAFAGLLRPHRPVDLPLILLHRLAEDREWHDRSIVRHQRITLTSMIYLHSADVRQREIADLAASELRRSEAKASGGNPRNRSASNGHDAAQRPRDDRLRR